MNALIFYQASKADIPSIIDARVRFLTEFLGEPKPDAALKLGKSLQEYFDRKLNQEYICWVAKDQDAIVGIGGMAIRTNPGNFRNPSGRVGYIMNMHTANAYRCIGIANRILNELIAAGTKMGINFFELHATKEGALVYEKYGFQLHKEPTYRFAAK